MSYALDDRPPLCSRCGRHEAVDAASQHCPTCVAMVESLASIARVRANPESTIVGSYVREGEKLYRVTLNHGLVLVPTCQCSTPHVGAANSDGDRHCTTCRKVCDDRAIERATRALNARLIASTRKGQAFGGRHREARVAAFEGRQRAKAAKRASEKKHRRRGGA